MQFTTKKSLPSLCSSFLSVTLATIAFGFKPCTSSNSLHYFKIPIHITNKQKPRMGSVVQGHHVVFQAALFWNILSCGRKLLLLVKYPMWATAVGFQLSPAASRDKLNWSALTTGKLQKVSCGKLSFRLHDSFPAFLLPVYITDSLSSWLDAPKLLKFGWYLLQCCPAKLVLAGLVWGEKRGKEKKSWLF